MRTVTVLPPTINTLTAEPIGSPAKRKVAAYARVSTDHEEQQSSYDAQVDYYTKYIQARDDWEFVGIYSDEGVTGTCKAKREGFSAMVADALAGKIDLIITKSVSRFARNTVDSLTTIRELKEHNTEVFFEKEGIWTFDSKGEVMLTILSSLSQEESRSISENVRWGHKKKFSDGKFSMPYSSFLGYDKGPDGSLVINEDQAVIVRRIFKLYLQGYSPKCIAETLTAEGIKTVRGKDKWNPGTIRGILSNEKYKGDALLQKTYTVDFLSKQRKLNDGRVQQYYVKDSHPAIIPPETFDMVQEEMERRKSCSATGKCIFSGKIICGDCRTIFGTKVWHSTDKYRRVIWQCGAKYGNGHKCRTPHLTEEEIKAAFISATNKIVQDRDDVIANLHEVQNEISDTTALELDEQRLINELNIVTKLAESAISRNARTAQNQEDYQKEYAELCARYDNLRAQVEAVQTAIKEKNLRRHKIGQFIAGIEKMPSIITEFDDAMWCYLVDHVTVYSKRDIRITFTSGTTIKA